MADLLPTMIAEFDTNFNLTFANKAVYDKLGFTKKGIELGMSILSQLHPDDLKKAKRNLKLIRAGKKFKPNEDRIYKKDGSELIGLINTALIKRNNKVVGYRSSIVDITELKKAEAIRLLPWPGK